MVFFFWAKVPEIPRMVYSFTSSLFKKKNDILFLCKYLIFIMTSILLFSSTLVHLPSLILFLIWFLELEIQSPWYIVIISHDPQFRLTIEFDFGPNRAHWNWYFAIKNKKLISIQNVISQTRFIKEYQLIVL